MARSAAIVLAGGRSVRMGADKAALDWHGSTLLRRVCGIVARAVDGPVIVVRAPGQELPALPASVEVVSDAAPGRGPLQGLYAGLQELAGRAEVSYVSSTDVPFLHPAFVRRVTGPLGDGVDVVLPVIGGHRQTLAAGYRVDLLATVGALLEAGEYRPARLFERCNTLIADHDRLLGDPALARLDPQLDSVRNLNDMEEYRQALLSSPPEIWIDFTDRRRRATRKRSRAWTLAGAATAAGVSLDGRIGANICGSAVDPDPELPLAIGDVVSFVPTYTGT